MIPTTKLVYSWAYNRELNPGLPDEEVSERFVRLKIDCKRFEEIYNQSISDILESIPLFTGYDWEEESIPVYLVTRVSGGSFSLPLTLTYHPNEKMMLAELVHELVHRNLQTPFLSGEQREACTNLVVRHVIGKVGVSLSRELETLDAVQRKKYPDFKCPSWDLEQVPLKQRIGQK